MRLEQRESSVFLSCNAYFNSIKVRLEQALADITATFHSNFNSIKVRLEPRKVLGVDVLRIYGFVGAKIQKNLQKNVDA